MIVHFIKVLLKSKLNKKIKDLLFVYAIKNRHCKNVILFQSLMFKNCCY